MKKGVRLIKAWLQCKCGYENYTWIPYDDTVPTCPSCGDKHNVQLVETCQVFEDEGQ